jgi:hypothetical protein
VKQLKDATQGHLDDTWKVDGAELHQVKIGGNVLKVKEQATLTKFDVEDSTGVVEVKLVWLDNGNDVFTAERRAACRYELFLAMSLLYSLMGQRQNAKRRAIRENLQLCVFKRLFFRLLWSAWHHD